MFRVYDPRGHGLLCEWCKWSGTCFRVKVNCCVQIPTWRSPFLALFLTPAAAFGAGMALPPVVYSLTLRGLICSYLKWQKEEEGEAKLLTWFSLSLLSQILFWSPPSWVLPQPSQIRCEQLLASWPDGPPCQLSDVTHQSSIFTANLCWSNFTFSGLWP